MGWQRWSNNECVVKKGHIKAIFLFFGGMHAHIIAFLINLIYYHIIW